MEMGASFTCVYIDIVEKIRQFAYKAYILEILCKKMKAREKSDKHKQKL
jgi:hypothetical protein